MCVAPVSVKLTVTMPKIKRYNHRRSINLSEELKLKLQIMSELSGVNEIEVIRIAIAEHWNAQYGDFDLEEYKHKQTLGS